jgi:hypothetical protein
LCWAKHAATAVVHFAGKHKVDIAIGAAGLLLLAVPGADEALLAGRLAATAGRAAGPLTAALRIYNGLPSGLSTKAKLGITIAELARPALVKAARIAALVTTFWRAGRHYGH